MKTCGFAGRSAASILKWLSEGQIASEPPSPSKNLSKVRLVGARVRPLLLLSETDYPTFTPTSCCDWPAVCGGEKVRTFLSSFLSPLVLDTIIWHCSCKHDKVFRWETCVKMCNNISGFKQSHASIPPYNHRHFTPPRLAVPYCFQSLC